MNFFQYNIMDWRSLLYYTIFTRFFSCYESIIQDSFLLVNSFCKIFFLCKEENMNLRDRVRELANSKGLSLPKLESELGFGNGTIVKWDKSTPNTDKLLKVANYLDVSLDYLMTGKESDKNESELTKRDERDIAKRLDDTLRELEEQQESLMFYGEPLDDETKELLVISLERSMRMAKREAKEKFTPKKYRKNKDTE